MKRKKITYLLIFSITFITTFIIITKDKTTTLNTLIKSITKNKNIINLSSIISPKEIVYSQLNKNVGKDTLTVFKSIYDDFDYNNTKSNYVVDTKPNENSNDPVVYIYNTHQTEEYDITNPLDYSVKPNVMIASYILREKLSNLGIPSVVETNNMKDFLTKNNYKYNMSYHASEYFARLKTKEYPSIKYLIDIHRDSLGLNSTLYIDNDTSYARILYVTGLEHTTKENNIGFAEELNAITERLYPGLSRGISYKDETPIHGVYNQNLNGKSILIEVGGVENKIEEVNNTMTSLARVIYEYIKGEENA